MRIPANSCFEPKSDFHKQIIAHRKDVPEKCRRIPTKSDKTDYDSLTDKQIQYYIWWRHCLRNGDMDYVNAGYVYLRMVEIAHGTDSFDSAMEQISLMRKHVGQYAKELDNLERDLCIAKGVDPVRFGDPGDVNKSALLAYPPKDMSIEDVKGIFEESILNSKIDVDVAHLFNDSLYEIDRYLLETFGYDLSMFYGTRVTRRHVLFESFYPNKEAVYYIEYDEYGDRLDFFLNAVLAYCIKKMNPKDAVSASSVLTKEMRGIIDATVLKGHIRRDLSCKGWKGYRIIPESECDSTIPLIRSAPGLHQSCESWKVMRSIYSLKEGRSNRVYAYQRCFSDKPIPWNMPYRQIQFYVYFRDMALNGKFIDSDDGYLWLLLVDLINNNYRNSLKTLIGVKNAYYPDSTSSLPGITAVEYAALMEKDIPDDSLYHSSFTYRLVMTQILEGRSGHLSADGLLSIASINNKVLRNDLDKVCVEVANIIIRVVNDEVSKGWPGGILSFCQLVKKSEITRVFMKLKHFQDYINNHTVPIKMINYRDNAIFAEGMETILRTVVQAVGAKRRNRTVSFNGNKAFGIDVGRIVTEVVDSYFDREHSSIEVDIDRDAVTKAQDDLNDVVRMMTIEGGETGGKVVEITVTDDDKVPNEMAGEDPWQTFFSSLTDDERSYLYALLRGGESKKRSVNRINSINSKAMDTIGDVLIDDSGLIEDYIYDVRRTVEHPE